MRRALLISLLFAVGCASSGPRWQRADGSRFAEEELQRDRQACFPERSVVGSELVDVRQARACMEGRGWVRASD